MKVPFRIDPCDKNYLYHHEAVKDIIVAVLNNEPPIFESIRGVAGGALPLVDQLKMEEENDRRNRESLDLRRSHTVKLIIDSLAVYGNAVGLCNDED